MKTPETDHVIDDFSLMNFLYFIDITQIWINSTCMWKARVWDEEFVFIHFLTLHCVHPCMICVVLFLSQFNFNNNQQVYVKIEHPFYRNI